MKFTRWMGELALAIGAIAGILYVSSPQLLPVKAQRSVGATPVQYIHADQALGLEKLIGIAEFVKAPTQYSFVQAEVDGGQGTGKVTGASLEGDRMTISYTYPVGNEVRTGELIGTVDSNGTFQGSFQGSDDTPSPVKQPQQALEKQSQAKDLEGDITFSFSADGTAVGTHNGEQGFTVNFVLQKQA
ncbi:MAG: hypothetical protein AAFV46_04415 [Cyanobacteria bacterium J06635_11]